MQELESNLQKEIDQSQHELSVLQDAHHQKLSNLNRKHQSEIESYKDRIEELEQEVDLNKDGGTASPHGDGGRLKEKLQQVQSELERTKGELTETETVNASLQSEISKLKLKERQSSKQKMDMEGKIDKLRKEKEELMKEKDNLEQINENQRRNLEAMEMDKQGSDDTSAQKELEEFKKLLEGMFTDHLDYFLL